MKEGISRATAGKTARGMSGSKGASRVAELGLLVLGVVAIAETTNSASVSAASLSVVLASTGGRRSMLELMLWIAGGAGVLGVVGWAVASYVVTAIAPPAGMGVGIAIGGGLGGVVRLLSGEEATDTSETMTVGMSRDEKSAPSPEPADLFEASPDPILYYDDAGDGPVIRAANPAFEETFGVPMDAVENAALDDGLMLTDTSGLAEAIAEGAPFDSVRTCETADSEIEMRVRLASVQTEAGSRGYILYTEVNDS